MGEDREKKSWRDLDRQRDKSAHRSDDSSRGKSDKEKSAGANYKKDLDALFDGGGIPDRFKGIIGDLEPDPESPEGQWRARIEQLNQLDSFAEFAKELRAFHKEGNAFPDDEDFLIRCLDHPTEAIVADAIRHILDLSSRRKLKRTTPMKSRLTTIRSIAEFPATLELLDQLEEIVG